MTDYDALSGIKRIREITKDGTYEAESLDVAKSAIRERIERDKGCNFCNNADMYSLLLCTYEVYYCPKCGRKLKE